ncbi:discoidin domain-containing protein [Sphaerisporangium sp. TRM90804]|uniref:discoidin domain-containing protein n=1 Tax=Sphaerisporangium sp. TRM90804 TaxID=3031113 RepID=UPI0024491CCE|nr:discoidin domain-containing protein [Sphaerisporangium sp. TRM90804]MDH2427183.1 discoidin domain-containing protein [Sphaerisporangium sp. TRM90804]
MPPSPRPSRLALLIALAVSLVTSILTIAPASAADPLLSQGKTATASSTEGGAFPASAAVDGNPGTRWSSGFADPQWIQVDLGVTANITQVVLNWEAAYGRAFQIQTSSNGSTWTPIYSTTTSTGGNQTLTVTGSGRYVRVYGTQRALQYGYSLWEFQVFGTTGTTPPDPDPGTERLLSYNKPGVASSSQSDVNCYECTPARAFDRDPASRWATSSTTGWVDPGWIYVDLGAVAQISRVVLQWDPAYARAFQIQTSNDAVNWTPIYSTTTGTGFKQTLTVSGSGRYVRMYGTQRSSAYGYSLWEFQVWGTGGAPNTPPPLPPDPRNPPQLVWSDEFNGAAGSKPDPAKWTIDTGTGPNNELEYYTNNNNASMNGSGSLVMEARREATPGSSCPGGTCQYTSHRMNTGGKFTFTYGRVEARVKVPKGNGLWPAFWMMGADFLTGRPWPYNGEIDIMEVLGKDTFTAYSTVHAPAYNGGGGIGAPYTLPGGADFASDYHVWAANWDSRGIVYTLDGRTVFTLSKDEVERTRGPWVFDHPFYLILNLAVGGDWPGPPDASTGFPKQMLVDYVRVYQ